MEGTHPHQWTPPTMRRVIDLEADSVDPVQRLVSNSVTHNGDFDFYILNGKTYDLGAIQQWLEVVTETPMPATVDSCAIAGMMDILRTRGCFGLSVRYAYCLGLSSSKMETFAFKDDRNLVDFPRYEHFEEIGTIFERILYESMLRFSLESFMNSTEHRAHLAQNACIALEGQDHLLIPLERFLSTDIDDIGSNIMTLCGRTVDAFFDNDLFWSTQTFLRYAKGSFGLGTSCSLDAHRQICIASRGQTNAVAFYPTKGIICYGSEQAAVKAAINNDLGLPDGSVWKSTEFSQGEIDGDVLRLDLDDLGGEVCLLDWGETGSPVSLPHHHLKRHSMMNGKLDVVLYQESTSRKPRDLLYHRLTRLTNNPNIKPLSDSLDSLDPVRDDLNDIPRVCSDIQNEFRSDVAPNSVNRLTAFNLSQCLRRRLRQHVDGDIPYNAVDIILTGCEVSLWVAEQFAADMWKCFPKLRTVAVSSNKILGLFGQDLPVPSIGFGYSPQTLSMHDAIVIIVSHSGGTFAPLACSSLIQSHTRNIFAITSEWDTQVGKQLRKIDELEKTGRVGINSRVFTTECGVRPAEPCSLTVVATHQLLTCLFEYISAVILSDDRFAHATRAKLTENDLQILERLNRDNIPALSELVGYDHSGFPFTKEEMEDEKMAEGELRHAGRIWSQHVLENTIAYIFTFVYIFTTVISGYPLVYAIAYGCGLNPASDWVYPVKALDAAIYFWMPQINVIIIRLIQRRNLLHRMTARTVVVGDIPWVSQSADAFLSKLFACSYSIVGLNVLSTNPVDHLVHRHTHRVVRGTLLVCGRPDGRLTALTNAEASVCLAVNQASSIQSFGGTCESITIGHNTYKLPLSEKAIFLRRKRPQFLCERLLSEKDYQEDTSMLLMNSSRHSNIPSGVFAERRETLNASGRSGGTDLEGSSGRNDGMDSSFRSSGGARRRAGVTLTVPTALMEERDMKGSGDSALETSQTRRDSIRKSMMKRRSTKITSTRKSSIFGLLNRRSSADGSPSPLQLSSHLSMSQHSKHRSASSLIGAYTNFDGNDDDSWASGIAINATELEGDEDYLQDEVIAAAIKDKKLSDKTRQLFQLFELNQYGMMTEEAFVRGRGLLKDALDGRELIKEEKQAREMFRAADSDLSGYLDLNDFVAMISAANIELQLKMPKLSRDDRGRIQVVPSDERYFGEKMRKLNEGKSGSDVDFDLTKSQNLAMELYETRIASAQRFVAMCVMFHEMGSRVEKFFEWISFELLGYRIDRTHSIMRIATTASPVSGAEVRLILRKYQIWLKVERALDTIGSAYKAYKATKSEITGEAPDRDTFEVSNEPSNEKNESGEPSSDTCFK